MKTLKLLSAIMISAAMMSGCSESKEQKDGLQVNDNSSAVIENIMTRTSVRKFTDRKISKDTMDILLKAGMAAPSAMDKRPWAFVVVTERTIMDSLNVIKPWFHLKTAAAAIVVCGDLSKSIEGEGREYWVQDCSAASENILLAAHGCGLGAVWCGVYPIKETVDQVSKILDLPENIIPLNVITLGYPDENPEPKDKFLEGNVHYQKW